MPNWCMNKMTVSSNEETVNYIERLINGEDNGQDIVLRKAIRMFVLGMVKVLQPVRPIRSDLFHPYNHDSGGMDSAKNYAYQEFLELLATNPLFDSKSMFKVTKLYDRIWPMDLSTLTPEKLDQIDDVLKSKAHDWIHSWDSDKASRLEWFSEDLSSIIKPKRDGLSLDFTQLIPLPLLSLINGFNGGLLTNVTTSYDEQCNRIGTKWAMVDIHDESLDKGKENGSNTSYISFVFETAWGPVSESAQTLSELFDAKVSLTYAEQGCDFCGVVEFDCGDITDNTQESLDWSEEDDEGFCSVIGPDFVVESFEEYGYGG